MGKFATGDKPKFDLITASKTKKYKIITAVILILGVVCLLGGILLRSFVTSTDTANILSITDLSGLEDTQKAEDADCNYQCEISTNQMFVLNTGTLDGHALSQPIVFTLDENAKQFLEVWNANETHQIPDSHYPGRFYLHIKDNAPKFVQGADGTMVNPTGKLTISCGSFVIRIKFIYTAK